MKMINPEHKDAFGIYKITCTANNKIYIGSTIGSFQRRYREHRSRLKNKNHKNPHLQAAYNKYGVDSFIFSVEKISEIDSEVLNLEQYYLDSYKSYDRTIGFNINKLATGSKGVKRSPEVRKILSIAARNRKTQPKGDDRDSHNKKLTSASVLKIRTGYQNGLLTRQEICDTYGICNRYLTDIFNNTAWTSDYGVIKSYSKTKYKNNYDFLMSKETDILKYINDDYSNLKIRKILGFSEYLIDLVIFDIKCKHSFVNKITLDLVEDIRFKYNNDLSISIDDLIVEFGLSSHILRKILNNKIWVSLTWKKETKRLKPRKKLINEN